MTMIVAKCPLRISLVGGSTDLDAFIQKYNTGSVISFPSDLFCYISIHDNHTDKFIINYSKKEEVKFVQEIKNDIARVVLEFFDIKDPITISFNTDILSEGSGLASSSAYTIACVKAVSVYKGLALSDFEISKISLELERIFNPLTGYQDSYGCAIGGFKKISFVKNKRPSFTYFDNQFIYRKYDLFLLHTNIKRNSTEILKSVNVDKSYPLLKLVEETEKAIEDKNYFLFEKLLNDSWEQKKKTSSLIADFFELKKIDDFLMSLLNDNVIQTIKLCGAGGGGYFLIFVNKEKTQNFINIVKNEKNKNYFGNLISIHVNESGVIGNKI